MLTRLQMVLERIHLCQPSTLIIENRVTVNNIFNLRVP